MNGYSNRKHGPCYGVDSIHPCRKRMQCELFHSIGREMQLLYFSSISLIGMHWDKGKISHGKVCPYYSVGQTIGFIVTAENPEAWERNHSRFESQIQATRYGMTDLIRRNSTRWPIARLTRPCTEQELLELSIRLQTWWAQLPWDVPWRWCGLVQAHLTDIRWSSRKLTTLVFRWAHALLNLSPSE